MVAGWGVGGDGAGSLHSLQSLPSHMSTLNIHNYTLTAREMGADRSSGSRANARNDYSSRIR